MILDPQRIPAREKLILAGLFLSKFDTIALKTLGFESFTEAFNLIGYALEGKPSSIKNYRDEFDPYFPNPRSGWCKRPTRDYCTAVLKKYGDLDLQTFGNLVRSFVGDQTEPNGSDDQNDESSFARRLITGLAAEHYFELVQPKLPEFSEYSLENTTRLGCGYDFRLRSKTNDVFLAVEVKGLRDKTGGLSLTSKEYDLATTLTDRFYLFVVKNFRENPFHEIFRNPLAGKLNFQMKKRVVVQVCWSTSI